MSVKPLRDHKLQDGVAEKLQPLIIKMFALRLVRDARMSQRLRQQKRIAKLVTDAFLERTHSYRF